MTDSVKIMPKSETYRTQGPHVVALAYDGLCTFEFGIAYEVFGLPRPENRFFAAKPAAAE